MKLSVKLTGSFAILFAITCSICFLSYRALSTLNASSNDLATNRLPSIKILGKISNDVSAFRRHQLLSSLSPSSDRVFLHKEMATIMKRLEDEFKTYEADISEPEEREGYPRFREHWKKVQEIDDRINAALLNNDNGTAATLATGPSVPEIREALKILDTLVEVNSKGGDISAAAAISAFGSGKTTIIISLLASILACGLLTFFIIRDVLRQLGDDPAALAAIAKRIADGDLTVRFDASKPEIGVYGAVKRMTQTIKNRVGFAEGVLRGISAPFAVLDVDAKILSLNQQIIDFVERDGKPEDYVGMFNGEFFYSDKNRSSVGSETVKQKKPISKKNVTVQSHKHNTRFCNIDASPITDFDGNIIAGMSIITDLTELAQQQQIAKEATARGMNQAANGIKGVVEIVTSASEELSAQIEQSSKGAEEQSQRVGETASAMEEMNATVLEVANNASQAAETSDKAKHKAEGGAGIVKEVVDGIAEVQKQALEMKDDMTSLGQQAQGIGQILNVISDIADQTNLLALNAAIEAARAGDAGRGFAVVADEVRKLAEKTMTATKEVGEAIRGIQGGTQKNIANVENAVKKINNATALAGKSGEALGEIVTLVDLATDQVRSIATASEQQSSASEEIKHNIEDVSRISAETADAMRQSAQAVGELANQALVLKNLVEELQADKGDSAQQTQLA